MNLSRKLLGALLFIFFINCTYTKSEMPPDPPETEKQAEGPKTSYITIIAAGDNLIHDIIYNRARLTGNEERFNFYPSYAPIKSILAKADLAFVNQETVLGGKEFRYTGYPVFNTPQDAGLGLINAGFNVINQASNHTMDRGEGAVYATMDFWESLGIFYMGIFRNEEIRNTEKRIIEKNGIKTGFLAYTFSLNGFPLPRDKPWLVGLIDKEVMRREINALRPHCDFLVVSLHWGNEFRHTASNEQKELARYLAGLQVDLILGHHPHVTGPMEVIQRPMGGELVVYYSLGDLLSHTQSSLTPDTITGALAYVRVKKTVTNNETSCIVETAGVIPTVCHYVYGRRDPFVVYPLWDYTNELASIHYKPKMSLAYLNNVAREVFGSRVITKEQFDEITSR
ncbi:MAG: CapA family protein [Treponema sp.]|jgi:poly-gamma-glutamate synthesis protein (capsule biosynthesis protein)|nr:CapA family protein [Treponema sp.]